MNPVEEDRALDGEDGLAYGARGGGSALDATTRHLVLIAGAIGVLLVIVIGGWMLSSRPSGVIPVVEAVAGPVRLKPVDPGGMQAMGAEAPPAVSAAGTETLEPIPETARPEALQAEVDAARRSESEQQVILPPTPAAHAGQTHATVPAVPAVQAAPVQPIVPDTGAADIAPAASDPAGSDAAPSGLRADADADSRPAANGRLAVQLAALPSSEAAQAEWTRLRHGHPTLFSGHTPEVEQADHAGRTIFRLRTRGFATAADVRAFCEQARSQHVACMPADF